MQSAMVVPVGLFRGGELDVVEAFPWAAAVAEFGVEIAVCAWSPKASVGRAPRSRAGSGFAAVSPLADYQSDATSAV